MKPVRKLIAVVTIGAAVVVLSAGAANAAKPNPCALDPEICDGYVPWAEACQASGNISPRFALWWDPYNVGVPLTGYRVGISYSGHCPSGDHVACMATVTSTQSPYGASYAAFGNNGDCGGSDPDAASIPYGSAVYMRVDVTGPNLPESIICMSMPGFVEDAPCRSVV
jgi:hypothetical protein